MIEKQCIDDIAAIFSALGDPTRLHMLMTLWQAGPLNVGSLAERVGMSDSAVSHQLRLLRALRLVQSERQGRTIIYRLDDEHIVGLLQQALDHQHHR